MSAPLPGDTPDLPHLLHSLGEAHDQLVRFVMSYEFAMQEVETKVRILQQEFQQMHSYNPIEHVTSRLKSMESIIAKAHRKGCGPNLDAMSRQIRDIAGVRVVCSFPTDVYRVQEMLCRQADVELLELRDYIAHPKPSGYRSLHAIVQVPVFLSDATPLIPVEMQFRTIAQDFWASLEHKIFYKYDQDVPGTLVQQLRDAAAAAADLDAEMERLSVEIRGLESEAAAAADISLDDVQAFLALTQREQLEPPPGQPEAWPGQPPAAPLGPMEI